MCLRGKNFTSGLFLPANHSSPFRSNASENLQMIAVRECDNFNTSEAVSRVHNFLLSDQISLTFKESNLSSNELSQLNQQPEMALNTARKLTSHEINLLCELDAKPRINCPLTSVGQTSSQSPQQFFLRCGLFLSWVNRLLRLLDSTVSRSCLRIARPVVTFFEIWSTCASQLSDSSQLCDPNDLKFLSCLRWE